VLLLLFVCLLCCQQENGTLPIGPTQCGAEWYAGSRQGYSTCGSYCWSSTTDEMAKGKYICQLSRVVEKSSAYALACMMDTMEKLEKMGWLDGQVAIQIFVDCGPSFRSREWISTILYKLPDRWRRNTFLNFFLESHGKTQLDGFFGVLSRRRTEAALSKKITTVEELVDVYQYDDAFVLRARESFCGFLPDYKKEEAPSCLFTRSSMPCGVRGSYSWASIVLDARRVSLCASDGLKVTGPSLRAFRIPGMHAGPLNTTTPVLVLDKKTEPPDADEQPEPMHHADLSLQAKVHDGWRLAYRTSRPEDYETSKSEEKLRRRHNLLGAAAVASLPQAHRHRSAAQLQAASEAASAKEKARRLQA
jgi:hypothetical protein